MKLKNFSLVYGTQVFKAFSEEPRIRILNLINEFEEMCISDLELILEYTQTKTSRHLTYLKNSNIVYSEKADQYIFYKLREQVEDIVKEMLKYLNKDRILTQDLETYKILFNNRELAAYRKNHKKW